MRYIDWKYEIKECDKCHITKPVKLYKWTDKPDEYLCDFCVKYLLEQSQDEGGE